jgi:hypothetical protein
MKNDEYQFDVALSFAGEQRAYVDETAAELVRLGVRVFYDDYAKADLWGKDLYSHLDYVYQKQAQYCVIFASAEYEKKVWTNHERSSAQARAIENSKQEYILPVRFDSTEIPGLRKTIGYLDAATIGPAELAAMVKKKLGPRKVTPGLPQDVDRLLDKMQVSGKKRKAQKKSIRDVAYDLYKAMTRMTAEERKAVAGVLAFGCRGSLPEGVHISLDYLSRTTGLPHAELLDCLAQLRSLNITVKTGPPKRDALDKGELAADDLDVLLSFWTPRDKFEQANKIAYYTVQSAAHHFCEDHGLEVVTRLDFHRLSSAFDGQVGVDCDDLETELAGGRD